MSTYFRCKCGTYLHADAERRKQPTACQPPDDIDEVKTLGVVQCAACSPMRSYGGETIFAHCRELEEENERLKERVARMQPVVDAALPVVTMWLECEVAQCEGRPDPWDDREMEASGLVTAQILAAEEWWAYVNAKPGPTISLEPTERKGPVCAACGSDRFERLEGMQGKVVAVGLTCQDCRKVRSKP